MSRRTSILLDQNRWANSFDAPYGLFVCHISRKVYITNIEGNPSLSAEFKGENDYWEAVVLADREAKRLGYEVEERHWDQNKHDPDQLRNYEKLPFADESEVKS